MENFRSLWCPYVVHLLYAYLELRTYSVTQLKRLKNCLLTEAYTVDCLWLTPFTLRALGA
jgi:hypothetical protein